MAKDILKNIRIAGIACCVPKDVVKMEDYCDAFGKDAIEKFVKTTGIKQKHCNKSKVVITTADLCYKAAEQLIGELDIDKQTIDAVILVTQSPDYVRPATACVLQYRLGLSNDCIAYDINLGCSGYINGLHVATSYLQSGHLKRVLLLAGDATESMLLSELNLFGEAGTATLVEVEEKFEDMKFILKTIGSGYKHLIMPYGGYRHGIGDNTEILKVSPTGIKYWGGHERY